MDATSLQQICAWTNGVLQSGAEDTVVTRLNTDSRTCAAGDLFVALRGENFDAHDFLEQVAASGATAALVDREMAPISRIALIRVDDTLHALQRLAGTYRASLALRVICITGSNGKTSTKDFTASVLGEKFRVFKTAGNLNNHIGVPLTLLRASAGDECAVVELGMNHPGEIAPLAALAQPQTAIITNVGTAHIEYMHTREAIALEKGALAEALPADGVLVLGGDNDFAEAMAARTKARVVLTGIEAGEVRAIDLRDEAEGSHFTLQANGESVSAYLPVPGRHMVRNALLAVGAGLAHGLTLAECARGLAKAEVTKGRVEQKQIRGLNVIDDSYNANPDSVIAALETIAHLPSNGRRFAVLGRMGELGSEAENGHRAVGAAAAREKIGCVISVGGEANWITEAAHAGGVAQTFHTNEIGEAVRLLKQLTRAGDVVLVKGSRSARMERIVEELALMMYYLHLIYEHYHWTAFNVFRYQTLRAFCAALTAFLLCLLFGGYVIRVLTALKLGQPIRTASEVHKLAELHGSKKGTPTMGGVLLIGSVVISSLLWARPDNSAVWLVLFSMVYLAGLGFWDDFAKVRKKNADGVSERTKLVAQFILALIVTAFFLLNPEINVQARELYVPFYKGPVIHDLGWATLVFFSLVIIGTSNAVNLTDGLDGLATGCTTTAAFAYGVLAYVAGNVKLADYLQVPYYPFVGELSVICMALVGASLGFLWFNCHPARVFMGDTGSLAIGGTLGVVAICCKQELLLMLVGGVFVVEAASVLIQRTWFKITKARYGEGRRVFLMSPIHHHFELKGWKENTVIVRFWILSIMFAFLALATLKLR